MNCGFCGRFLKKGVNLALKIERQNESAEKFLDGAVKTLFEMVNAACRIWVGTVEIVVI